MISGFFTSQLILIIFNELVFIDLTSFSFFGRGRGGRGYLTSFHKTAAEVSDYLISKTRKKCYLTRI